MNEQPLQVCGVNGLLADKIFLSNTGPVDLRPRGRSVRSMTYQRHGLQQMAKQLEGTARIPSGEGERRAMRGYVPQYDFAAHLIYEGLADGQLKWVGLADRGAGCFDDVVLGLQDRIVGYQIKTQTNPEAFGLQSLLFGAEKLAKKLYHAWKQLKLDKPGARVQVAYLTRDFPRLNDTLGPHDGDGLSSAAFLRAHGAHGGDWGASDWLRSPFSEFIKEIIGEVAIEEDEFSEFWQNVLFWTNDSGKQLGLRSSTTYEERRIIAISSLLPRLIASASDKDRWTAAELLRELRWDDPFGLRHEHVFPLDSLVQSNKVTEGDIEKAFGAVVSGYISLVDPPGSGKSTLLQAGLLPIPSAIFVRYLAFVPDEGHGLGRAEAFDFLQDLISQLKRQGLGTKIVPATALPELRLQLVELLRQAAARFEVEGVRTVIVIDGLDHIPREERPERSLLHELPLPHAIPRGVIFMLGTQRLELDELPPAVRDQAKEEGRKIEIAPLAREAVHELVDAAGVTHGVNRDDIFERSEGHPLSVRYIVEGLLRLGTDEERQEWLANGPSYGGDVSTFYESAWRGLETNPEARRIFGYLALAEGAVDPARLDEIVDRASTDAAWRECLHLLRIDRHGRWSIFHNSFRLFLLEKTSTRFGLKDPRLLKERYIELAQLASRSSLDDPQRWMELRYNARADEDEAVLRLAAPHRLRAQFVEGRNPADIYADIRLAFRSVRNLRAPTKLYELILSKHEIEMRSDAIGVEELVEAYIATDRLDVALGLIQAGGISLPTTSPYIVIDALLQAGRNDEARFLFEESEPIEKLLGSEVVDLWHRDEELYNWAAYALTFREPRHFLACLDRLREPLRQFGDGNSLDDLKDELKLIAARSEFEAKPDQEVEAVAKRLQVRETVYTTLFLMAAESAYDSGLHDLAKSHFRIVAESAQQFDDDTRRNAARILLSLGELDLAVAFLDRVVAPTLVEESGSSTRWLVPASRRIMTHAACEAQLATNLSVRSYPESQLLNAFQRRLEELGRLIGRGRAGEKKSAESIWQEVSANITLLQLGGIEEAFSWERYELNKAMPTIASAVVLMCGVYGDDVRRFVSGKIDEILEGEPGLLGGSDFRRAYAAAMFAHERSLADVERRLAITGSIERHNTPQEYVQEVAEMAITLAHCGGVERAVQLLGEMHDGALGISRPPKKDAQYIMWRNVFQRACIEEPETRSARVRFFSRLLDGLSNTEGSGSAWRVAPTVLIEAAQGETHLAMAAASRMQEAGLLSWEALVGATLKGVAKKRDELAGLCVVLFGRIALPFSNGYDDEIYPLLLQLVRSDRREAAMLAAIDHIQVDAQGQIREAYLNQVDVIARRAGTPNLARVSELLDAEVDRQVRLSDDPYMGLNSLAELSTALREQKDDKKIYSAVKAFERIAAHSEYQEVREFVTLPELAKDERAVVIAARAAIASGALFDARQHIAHLSALAEGQGSWGEWQSGTKLRLYQLRVDLEGEQARLDAFDVFARDMARGGEWSSSLIPDLASVFELISPRPSWSEMWGALTDHLSLFRDYRLGRDLLEPEIEKSPEDLVAELLFQAIDLSSVELSRQVKVATSEIVDWDGGPAVIVALLNRLSIAGGDHVLEAASLAWGLRYVSEVSAWAATESESWSRNDDLAIIRYGMLFANEFERDFEIMSRELPGIYRLVLLPSQESAAQNYDPPSGFSEVSSGMWTEDSFSLTWPLERPLNILERATRFKPSSMRIRAAQLMRDGRGNAEFSREAVSALESKFRRLELRIFHRRLPVSAAFRAARRVAGELASAGELDLGCAPLFLSSSGAPDLETFAFAPVPRPHVIDRPRIPSAYETGDLRNWLDGEGATPFHKATSSDKSIIAAAGSFDRVSMRRDAVEEHLLLYSDIDPDAVDLDEVISALPRLILCDGPTPLYRETAVGGIVSIKSDIAGSIPDRMITVCPILAGQIGLFPTGPNLMSYQDKSGQIQIETVWWRDGGAYRRSSDGVLRGEGFVVTATDVAFARLRPFLGETSRSHLWRRMKSQDAPQDDGAKYRLLDP